MLQQKFVAFAGVAGEQDELARVVTERYLVLRLLRLAFYAGTGMCQPGDHTHQQRFAGLFWKRQIRCKPCRRLLAGYSVRTSESMQSHRRNGCLVRL